VRVLLQRVIGAKVEVEGEITGSTGPGLLLFVGISEMDTETELKMMAEKVANLRIFEDAEGRMNRSALDRMADGELTGMLVVSQFTLYGDVRKGRRPSFTRAAGPDIAAPMIDRFVELLQGLGFPVESGRFGAHMMVSLVNDGPVTIWIDSEELRKSR
jgi:D-tyrosyl-tRNA(Tyr) deacylase